MYPVSLKLGWKHSVSCVSGTSQTRNTHHRRESTCCPYTIPAATGAAAAGAALATIGVAAGARTGSSGSDTSSSLASAAGATLLAHDARSGLGLAAGGIAACLPRHCAPVGRQTYTCTLTSVYFVPVYLAVYLVCICFQDRNTQIHAYPHPSPSVSNI